MDADATAELRRLRARAYGPGADIHDDPAAMRRLEELEERNRPGEDDAVRPARPSDPVQARPAAAIGTEDPADPEDPAGPEDRADPEDPTDPGDASDEPAEAPRRFRFWVPSLWAASLLVVAVLAGVWTLTTTVAVLTPIERTGEGRQIAVLHVDPGFQPPPIFGQGEVGQVGYEDFHGLTAISTTGSWMGGPGAPEGRCLFVMRTDAIDVDSQSFNGPIFNDCTAGTFPATIEIGVGRDLPAEIRDRFPEGSALQFVLDGDRVGVFTDAG
ncbi:hypothetical protein [Microbacterium sp. BK668]|uniref:hypothetical protein n=1 Tax=Microbacterium sp. BK668 TaxID=2512118 RepID=UPI00105FB794|nr:hypothetical protein [Microbacterium sp. BK668]